MDGRRRQCAVQIRAEGVDGAQVQFLDDLGVGPWAVQHLVAGVGDRPTGGAQQTPSVHPVVACGLGRGGQVRATAAAGEHEQHVAGPAVGADLSGEDLLEAVVVAECGRGRAVGAERDRGQRLPVGAHCADKFGGQMLRGGGAAAVAGDQQPPTGVQVIAGPGPCR